VAERHGIDISQGRVRAFAARDFDRFDRIVVVDRRNHDLLLAQAGDDRDRLKLRLLRGEDGDVADPVFGTEEHYERAFAQIDEACDRLLEEVRASLSES
jgi:protein-tyrosine-phosphatase